MQALTELPFNGAEKQKTVPAILEYFARRFSRINVSGGGSGDDCSLVLLKQNQSIKPEETFSGIANKQKIKNQLRESFLKR